MFTLKGCYLTLQIQHQVLFWSCTAISGPCGYKPSDWRPRTSVPFSVRRKGWSVCENHFVLTPTNGCLQVRDFSHINLTKLQSRPRGTGMQKIWRIRIPKHYIEWNGTFKTQNPHKFFRDGKPSQKSIRWPSWYWGVHRNGVHQKNWIQCVKSHEQCSSADLRWKGVRLSWENGLGRNQGNIAYTHC